MGRRRKHIVRRHVTLPEELAAKIDFWLVDPVSGKNRYAAFSTITQHLWMSFIRHLETPGVDPFQLLRQYGIDAPHIDASADDDAQSEPQEDLNP